MQRTKLARAKSYGSSISNAPGRAEKNRKHAARSRGETALRKKTAAANPELGQLRPKKTATKPKAKKLVCRYCGSGDLAPSFIKRRDRRCRQCFSKRYGSAARARKTKTTK